MAPFIRSVFEILKTWSIVATTAVLDFAVVPSQSAVHICVIASHASVCLQKFSEKRTISGKMAMIGEIHNGIAFCVEFW
jgi:hypothetical protein